MSVIIMKKSTHHCSQLVPIQNLFHIKQKIEALTKGYIYKVDKIGEEKVKKHFNYTAHVH